MEASALPLTSFLFKWVVPRTRKESSAKISDTDFRKHVYGRTRKHNMRPITNFDPRPNKYRGNTRTLLPEYLRKVSGEGNGVSFLLDANMQVWSNDVSEDSIKLPSKSELEERVSSFIESLHLSQDGIRDIERNTVLQHQSPLWYSTRKYRLTASMFGEVLRRRPNTSPDSLVLRVIEPKRFTTPATEWGKENKPIALEKYKAYQKSLGHFDVTVCRAGFVVCETHPFLGASPDAYVHDPDRQTSYGLAEVKCSYKYRDVSVEEACKNPDFCAEVVIDGGRDKSIHLKHSHVYYSQVQGQLAITGRTWCDFILYTNKGFTVDTITFNETFWNNELLPALDTFYRNCIAPEIVSPIHYLGLPVRDLRKIS